MGLEKINGLGGIYFGPDHRNSGTSLTERFYQVYLETDVIPRPDMKEIKIEAIPPEIHAKQLVNEFGALFDSPFYTQDGGVAAKQLLNERYGDKMGIHGDQLYKTVLQTVIENWGKMSLEYQEHYGGNERLEKFKEIERL